MGEDQSDRPAEPDDLPSSAVATRRSLRLETLACALWGHEIDRGPADDSLPAGGTEPASGTEPAAAAQPVGGVEPAGAPGLVRPHPADRAPASQPDGWLQVDGGRRFVRCKRCDAWLELTSNTVAWRVAHRPHGTPGPPGSAGPARGTELRSLLIARIAAVWVAAQALALVLAAVAALLLARHLPGAENELHDLVEALHRHTELGHLLARRLLELEHARPGSLRLLAVAFVAGAVIDATAAVGLWRGRSWGAYLTVLAAAGSAAVAFPLLGATTTPTVVAGLNLVVAVWLIWDWRLFWLPVRGSRRRGS